jgi:hypothetical protein
VVVDPGAQLSTRARSTDDSVGGQCTCRLITVYNFLPPVLVCPHLVYKPVYENVKCLRKRLRSWVLVINFGIFAFSKNHKCAEDRTAEGIKNTQSVVVKKAFLVSHAISPPIYSTPTLTG